eukprot:UN24362
MWIDGDTKKLDECLKNLYTKYQQDVGKFKGELKINDLRDKDGKYKDEKTFYIASFNDVTDNEWRLKKVDELCLCSERLGPDGKTNITKEYKFELIDELPVKPEYKWLNIDQVQCKCIDPFGAHYFYVVGPTGSKYSQVKQIG